MFCSLNGVPFSWMDTEKRITNQSTKHQNNYQTRYAIVNNQNTLSVGLSLVHRPTQGAWTSPTQSLLYDCPVLHWHERWRDQVHHSGRAGTTPWKAKSLLALPVEQGDMQLGVWGREWVCSGRRGSPSHSSGGLGGVWVKSVWRFCGSWCGRFLFIFRIIIFYDSY